MLGKKQSIPNTDWLNLLPFIKNIVPIQEIKRLEAETIADIQAKTAGMKSAYAWSGGKDSIVLGSICEKAGITDCMIGVCHLEYPDFIKWINANKPSGLEIINTGQDMAWLVNHPEMLFPGTQERAAVRGRTVVSLAAKWFSVVQHKAQAKYFTERKLDVLLLGRRRADGNFIGRGSNIYTTGNGTTRYSPIAYWTHEQVLAYIAHNGLSLPPIYGWLNGYKCGTHPWPARQWMGTTENAWREIFTIDPSIVLLAADYIESAKTFMEGMK